jgi:hypothetical protein
MFLAGVLAPLDIEYQCRKGYMLAENDSGHEIEPIKRVKSQSATPGDIRMIYNYRAV